MRQQLEIQPNELFAVMPTHDSHSKESKEHWMASFISIWQEIWNQMTAQGSASVDSIISHLATEKMLQLDSTSESMHYARNLVFAIVGWQTMLYRPDMRSCCPAQLAIADETDGHRGQAYLCLRQSQSVCKRSLHDFLVGFGLLLPPSNFCALTSETDKGALSEIKTAGAESLNAHLLSSLGGISIK